MDKWITINAKITMDPSGFWFRFRDGVMRPVTQPDESRYAYSHGGDQYRTACETIAKWKEQHGWGGV